MMPGKKVFPPENSIYLGVTKRINGKQSTIY
jgi:hypothetical protein